MITSYLTLEHFLEIEPRLNRRKLCEATGINYNTLTNKIYRANHGKNSTLSIEQSEKIIEYLVDSHDILTSILTEEPE